MKQIISRLIDGLLDYVMLPVIMFWMAAHAALWDERIFSKDRAGGLISGIFFLLLVFAFVYENGYKKFFRFGRKKYFYAVHIVPLCIAIVGFSYGLWVAYR